LDYRWVNTPFNWQWLLILKSRTISKLYEWVCLNMQLVYPWRGKWFWGFSLNLQTHSHRHIHAVSHVRSSTNSLVFHP
jgi:hypothetical protein